MYAPARHEPLGVATASDVPVGAPFVGVVFVLDECEACAETVLRGEAADGDVHGLAHDEGLAAAGEAAEVEFACTRRVLRLQRGSRDGCGSHPVREPGAVATTSMRKSARAFITSSSFLLWVGAFVFLRLGLRCLWCSVLRWLRWRGLVRC